MRLLSLTVPLLLLPLAYAASGGPDAGGMVYTDSNGADGPAHVWLDASGGTPYALGGDASVTVAIPFGFTFYGEERETVTVSSNGALFFDGATTDAAGSCPGTSTSWTGIAAYWDDLAASTVYVDTFGVYPWRTFVVSWEDVGREGAPETGRFQVWLLEGRDEAVVVLDDTDFGDPAYDDGATAVIGANGASGGLPWACATAFSGPASIWFAGEGDRPDRTTIVTDDLDWPWTGTTDFDYAGRALAAGDLNADGVDDLVVGTQDQGAGVVSLIYRPDTGDVLSNADATLTGRLTDDDYGAALLLVDLDGDAQDELVVGAPGNDDAANRAGAVYLWDGGSWAGTVASSGASATWTGPAASAALGTALAAGDVDGDGYTDVVVGAPTADGSGTDAGAVYVVYGDGTLPTGTSAIAAAAAAFHGVDSTDQLGGDLAVGDLDGDGAAEIVASALFADDGATNAGTVYVVPGGSYAGDQYVDAVAACSFSSGNVSARLGDALLVADLDGSGLFDLAVGASTDDGPYTDGGDAYVLYDPGTSCPATSTLADATITGVRTSANLGGTLAAGDVDGDGVDDLLVGAPNMTVSGSGGGAVYVFTTAPTGSVAASTAAHTLAGSGSAAALGTAIAVAENADGSHTVALTAPYDSVAYASEGAVYQWTWSPDFLDADGDGFVSIAAGGNDCDDTDASASPDGTDVAADGVDGDCDGWIDGRLRVREDEAGFDWDVENLRLGETLLYDFESYTADTLVTTYADLTFTGTVYADDRVYGAAPVDAIGARVATSGTNVVGIEFADPIDAIALRVLDPSDEFRLSAVGPSGTIVSNYTFELSGEDRPGGVYRAFSFAREVTYVTLTGDTSNGFGLDAIEVAWAVDSDRDGDGYAEIEGDCDDTDAAISPGATEDVGNGIDDNCDGVVDAGAATAFTNAAAWEAAAGLDLTTVIDFEDQIAGVILDEQYSDLGVLLDSALTAAATVDGTPARGTMGARATDEATTILFAEDQRAIAFYVLDGEVPFTVEAYDDGVLYYSTTFTPSSDEQFYGLTFDLSVDEILIEGVDTWGLDDIVFTALGQDDADGDGYTERDGDCDDTEAIAYTGAEEIWYDGIDGDCGEDDDFDADGDGTSLALDCDDEDASRSPSARETYYDGVDQNCDELSDFDADEDGHDDRSWGGDDCDDSDDGVSPDAEEVWYDGVDQDCDEGDDYDADGDGVPIDGVLGGTDCDDTDASVSPDAEEIWYDGVDGDCSGDEESDYDADGDGYDSTAWGGNDCNDAIAAAYPGAPGEACYDGIDQDCDGSNDYDCDADGYSWDRYGGEDCDDADGAVNPDASDAMGDGVDTNCDGGPEYDFDGDGYDAAERGGGDCDDGDPTIRPDAEDPCYDGLDQDCDGANDYDCDGDAHVSDLFGGDDCDDAVGAIHPGALDFPYDGVDHDCAGDSEFDVDGDGHATAFYGGDDCDDRDADAYPGAVDACYDGVDADCGGDDDDDCDGDGYAADGAGGADCDDGDAAISPGAAEVPADGVDQDCDGEDLAACDDCDGDGFGAGLDCDDTDGGVYPGADDRPYDGVDADCGGDGDYDDDGDGFDASAWGGGDCDDADAAVSPANTEDPCGGGDEDCDGVLDDDCEPPVDTGPDDTGEPHDTDIPVDTGATRDTAVDWRPEGEDPVAPTWEVRDGGCSTSGGSPVAALGLIAAALGLARRRR